MQGVSRASKLVEKQSSENETARDRVKKMLQREQQDVEKPSDAVVPDAQSDDDDVPVAPRRLKRKTSRSPAQNTTPQHTRSSSPGLFISSPIRPSPTRSTQHNSDSEDNMPAAKSDRSKALERKRQERLAREAAEEAKNVERREAALELDQMASDDNDLGITDDEGGRTLTQNDRPKARKASKKAIEDMNRETQRMARNMQLAHEAKTRKKITKNSLFERFNFRPAGESEPKIASSSRTGTPHSDVEMQDADTPPSSPPVTKEPTDLAPEDEQDVLAKSSKSSLGKGKGKAVEIRQKQDETAPKTKRQVRVKLPPVRANLTMLDSDDELEITTTTKDRVNAVFESIPTKKAQEPHSIQALRALAQVRSPGKDTRKRDDGHSMTVGELQSYLQQKAKQQAKRERERRVEMLKAQGVVIQTAEERERQMQEVDDIVARARDEAQNIMKEERAAAKKERRENGEVDPLAWDDSDDEEYQASADEANGEQSALELSGSEEEDGEEDEDEESEAPGSMLEAEAVEAGSESDASVEEAEEDANELPVLNKRRVRKQPVVISDDEDEEEIEVTPKPKTTMHTSPTAPDAQSPVAPTSVLRSAKKSFIPGLPVQGPAGLGLTQIFAGTMDDSQMGPASGPTQSMMPDFENFPDSNFSATMDDPVEDMVMDSQNDDTQKTAHGIRLDFSQSQMHGLGSLLRDESTQFSEMIELSQDAGIQEHTPLRERFVESPHSTVETVIVDHDAVSQGSPLARRGRLRRRIESTLRIEETPEPTAVKEPEQAFSLLKEGVRKEKMRHDAEEFNRKKSKAKEMVEEQADESEDEYAGLGGVDGEDSDDESVASLKEIIDDEAGNNVDEAKLAAFYA